MHNPKELQQFKSRSITRAAQELNSYVSKNKDALKFIVIKLSNALDKKEAAVAGKLSYQLLTTAPLYGRSDIANMADFLCKILKNDDFNNVDEMFDLFNENFKELNALSAVNSEIEQKILTKTRNALVRFRA